MAAGGVCPVTNRWLIGTDALPLGAAAGGRPVYAFLADSGSPAYYEAAGIGGWQRVDVLWVAEPGFVGKVTVSGARLDGPGDVSFGDISERVPSPRVELDATLAAHGRPVGTNGWTVPYRFPMLVKSGGCYGLRIDTDQGSSVSVFDVRPVEIAYEELERRPVGLPSIANGGACPVTPISGEIKFRGWLGSVHGEGPVYVAGSGEAPMIWVADSRELGPIVIRGGRIDAPGDLRFEVGAESSPVLRLPIHSYVESEAAQQPAGWRQWLSSLQPSPPGCYAVQVDTLPGSQLLVFELGG